jgi:mRNA interferase MazF
MVNQYIPDRGHIVWVNFSPNIGHEQAGIRPALVLSPNFYNANSGLMLACPITSKVKGYPFEVRIKDGSIDGVILADQAKSLDWRCRPMKYEQTVAPDILRMTQRLISSLVSG